MAFLKTGGFIHRIAMLVIANNSISSAISSETNG
jgi:hypothetical protein